MAGFFVYVMSDMLQLVVSRDEDFLESRRQAKAYRTPVPEVYLTFPREAF